MEKVKEEFILSLIFVGKWLFLGLGIVGVLYVAISLAYNKSYYEPRMDKYDLELAEIAERIDGLKDTKITLENDLGSTDDRIKLLEKVELLKVEKEIERSKELISTLGLKWWQKLPIPMLKESESAKKAYETLKKAENKKSALVDEIEKLRDKRKNSNTSISNVLSEIQNYEMELSEKKRDKKRAEVDVKGPMLWLAGILGLT